MDKRVTCPSPTGYMYIGISSIDKNNYAMKFKLCVNLPYRKYRTVLH